MASKIYDGDIPFGRDGAQLHYGETRGAAALSTVWKPNFSFHGELQFLEFRRGRSAAYAVFGRIEEECVRSTVVVFLADLGVMLPHMRKGSAKGEFTFCKRGQNYGCRMII